MTQQIQQPQNPAAATPDSRMSALETRVDGLAGTLNGVAQAVQALGEKIDRRGQTPWAVIWSALGTTVGVITVVGGLAYYPLKDGQADLKSSLLLMQERAEKRIEQLSSDQVKRAEHELHWRSQERDYDFQRDRIARVEARSEKRDEELHAELRRLEANVVSRNELAGRFEAQDRVLGMVRGEVDEHIRAFNERQQRRIDALDASSRK